MKYLKVPNLAEFNSVNESVSNLLGLPNDKALTALEAVEVSNKSHPDYGLLVSRVPSTGQWKCDHLIDASLIVDLDEDWFSVELP